MKCIRIGIVILGCLSAASVAGQNRSAARPAAVQRVSIPQPAQSSPLPDVERARTIQYTDRDVVKVRTKVRYTSVIVLPKDEQILDFVCGDKDAWVVDGSASGNLAYVKPAKAGAQTNLNLVTASGAVYSFILVEVSDTNLGNPDFKILVEKIGTGPSIDDYRRQLELAKEEASQAKAGAPAAIEAGINQFLSKIWFPFRFEGNSKTFGLREICTDGKFTYILAQPEELPALYEIKDRKPSLINFKFVNGVYVVEKLLDQGYLVIGKNRLYFEREK